MTTPTLAKLAADHVNITLREVMTMPSDKIVTLIRSLAGSVLAQAEREQAEAVSPTSNPRSPDMASKTDTKPTGKEALAKDEKAKEVIAESKPLAGTNVELFLELTTTRMSDLHKATETGRDIGDSHVSITFDNGNTVTGIVEDINKFTEVHQLRAYVGERIAHRQD